MKETEYYNGDILEIKEMIDTFNQYKETSPEIKQITEEHGDLAEAFGRFAVRRGYEEEVISQFLTEMIDLTKDFGERNRAQGINSKDNE